MGLSLGPLALPFRLALLLLRYPFALVGSVPIAGWILRRIPLLGRLFWALPSYRCSICRREFTSWGGTVRWSEARIGGRPVKVCRRGRCRRELARLLQGP